MTTDNKPSCPSCDSEQISVAMVHNEFTYGVGDGAVTLPVFEPVFHCRACDGSFRDYRSEKAREAAIRKHLWPEEMSDDAQG